MNQWSESEVRWKRWVAEHVNSILRVTIIVVFLLLAIWALTLVFLEEYRGLELVIANSAVGLWLTAALKSVGPELAGIVIGVVTIDYLNERRQREQLKAQLIRQMGSNIRDVAVPAARELAHHGWLQDGSLRGKDLRHADLTGANLEKADLQECNLKEVNLTGANLRSADLRRCILIDAKLDGADLNEAKLRKAVLFRVHAEKEAVLMMWVELSGATLENARLPDAILRNADLTEANLARSNLGGAKLEGAKLDRAVLEKANLGRADLTSATGWTVEQIDQARGLDGTRMPNRVRLVGTMQDMRPIEGPSFEEWKVAYLAEHGGDEQTVRDVEEHGEAS